MPKTKMLTEKENDNPNFILNCEKIIQNRIELWKPNNIFVTRIDNWFDGKWMNYAGTKLHAISFWNFEDILTVPPFHPNRVESSDFYQKTAEQYVKKENQNVLHIIQESKDNLKRYISDFSTDGLFIWYSGNSKTNGRGTLMCYFIRESETKTFFITLSGKKDWDVSQTKGVLRTEIQNIIEKETAEKHSWQHRI